MSMWSAFEIGINVFQASLYLYFIKSFLNIVRKSIVADILAVSIYSLFLTSYLFYDSPLPDSLGCIIFFIYLKFTSNEKWHVCAFWLFLNEVITIAIVGFMSQVCLSIFSIPYEVLISHTPIRVIFVITTNFVLFLAVYIIAKFKTKASPLNRKVLLLFSTLNITILIVIELLFSLQTNQPHDFEWVFYISYCSLFFSSILSVILFHYMTTISEREHQTQIALKHAQLTREYQLLLKDMYTDMIARQHDFKHQLQAVEQLVKSGNSDAAKDLFARYQNLEKNGDEFLTGNIAVDALLTAKTLACAHQGITLELTNCPLNELPISEVDFCAIIGNLLDNAIEGILRIENQDNTRAIILSFSRVWDMFSIRCENPLNLSTVRLKDNTFISSKKNEGSAHGYGIPNIKRIVEGAEGFCSFDLDDNRFIATITLPYPLRKEGAQCIELQK